MSPTEDVGEVPDGKGDLREAETQPHEQQQQHSEEDGGDHAHRKSSHHHHHHKEQAAQLIQRNYRGYRERRQLKGWGLDASSRWSEAVKEARWRNATRPLPPTSPSPPDSPTTPEERSRAGSEAARRNWKRVGEIARRAGGDDPSDASEKEDDKLSPEERREQRQRKAKLKAEREKTAKMMDLQYFLEMVDQKHRYGSNLRAYHDHWKKSETHENFFYWLDYGAGKDFEHPTVSRDRLEKEQVRYLTREERMKYLVKIDSEGRLCWVKNGERISTSMEYKDSIEGIVPKDDTTPAYSSYGRIDSGTSRRNSTASSSSDSSSSSSSSLSSYGSSDSGAEHSDVEGEHYVNRDLNNAKGLRKIKYVSAATILNHLLRGSVKPNTWIFVADTSFRLYIGIKQSGAFQHSSFLHGARISAAGLIKVKNGQLRRLSPLSGHYRPPTKNFRAFVHALQDGGVDMSRVSISRSYAVLVGLEAYVKTRRKIKHGKQHVADAETKVMHPEEHKRRKEAEMDKSKSAERERQLLASNREKELAERKENSWHRKLWKKMRGASISSGSSLGLKEKDKEKEKEKEELKEAKERKHKKVLSQPGEDAESGISPDGRTRDHVETP